MKKPLVSVICLCYNQSKFVIESLDSVLNQNYDSVELIIVDDASTDGSKKVIKNWLKNYPEVPFLDLPKNLGNTEAFNQGLSLAKGKYIIDLAADDMLLNNRIAEQVIFFEKQRANVGVIYSDTHYMDENGHLLYTHFEGLNLVPFEGDVYERLIDTYFVPTPTMMVRSDVLTELSGYDESLAYEDFDFWIRSSRKWHYAYQPEVLTATRLVSGSQSTFFYHQNDKKLFSTLKVCRKIQHLNKCKEEDLALSRRVKYEIRHAFLAGKKAELNGFFSLLKELSHIPIKYKVIQCIGQLGFNWNWMKNPIYFIKK
ncbi:MAG: glycosyltransferase [Reichenbachiella sp.]|uniref:glycosyltransferase n=1 Tax=Reichenbachiella sp. TaxID=2184521 RepID=UPI003298EC9A